MPQPKPVVAIRKFRSADEAFLLSLSEAAFAEFSRDKGRSTLRMAEHWTCLVAEHDESLPASRALAVRPSSNLQPVGFVIVKAERGALAEVLAIAAVEAYRGRGVGRALLEAAERHARAAFAVGMMLHTADANVAAFELFTKAGFSVRRRIPRFYVGVYDACEMQKDW